MAKLYINTDFFNFKSCKKVHSAHPFFYKIFECFNDSKSSPNHFSDLVGKDNKKLFYTGLEQNAHEICERKNKIISKDIRSHFMGDSFSMWQTEFVKIEVPLKKECKGKKGLGILLYNFLGSNAPQISDDGLDIENEDTSIYLLYLLDFDNFHQN